MGICYHCCKELDEQKRCKLCNLTFCDEHLAPEAHNCIALSKDFKVKKGKEVPQPPPVDEVENVEGEEPPVEGVRQRGIKYLPAEEAETQVKEVKKCRSLGEGVNRVRVEHHKEGDIQPVQRGEYPRPDRRRDDQRRRGEQLGEPRRDT